MSNLFLRKNVELEKHRSISDGERLQFLKDGGYLPYGFDPCKILVDWAIEHGYGPAYWRQPENSSEIEKSMPPEGNGLVCTGRTDRDRIDSIIRREP